MMVKWPNQKNFEHNDCLLMQPVSIEVQVPKKCADLEGAA